jgi:gliding motility-associated-like protein
LKGEFTWKTNCSLLGSNFSDKSYYVTFIAEDANNCLIRLADTIRVRIDLSADPNNTPPTIVADGIAYDAAEGAYKVTINVNQTIGFDLVADDADKNEITLSGAGVGFDFASLDMSFETKVGLPILRSSYKWTPTCSMMGGAKEKMFEMNFIASDITPCGKRSSTPAKVKILVKDFAQVPDFLPPNVFTPNSDGKNDAFTMPALPLNTCEDQFESIKIYNRWDKLVYESTDRNFAWEATNFPSGVYYYLLRFSRKDFKGTVTLIGK